MSLFPRLFTTKPVNIITTFRSDIIQTSKRKMSFFRSNDNYDETDKFAWEIGQEALGITPLNQVGILKQTPYHFAMLNKSKTHSLHHLNNNGKIGNFGSSVKLHPMDYQEQFRKLSNQPEEIRIPKQLIHTTDQMRSFSVGGYEYRALFHGHGEHVYIPKSGPANESPQLGPN